MLTAVPEQVEKNATEKAALAESLEKDCCLSSDLKRTDL